MLGVSTFLWLCVDRWCKCDSRETVPADCAVSSSSSPSMFIVAHERLCASSELQQVLLCVTLVLCALLLYLV